MCSSWTSTVTPRLLVEGGVSFNRERYDNLYQPGILADRGTWLSFKNRQDLKILVEGDARLFNQYGVMLVNPARHPHVKAADGQRFIDWLVSREGQAAIALEKADISMRLATKVRNKLVEAYQEVMRMSV